MTRRWVTLFAVVLLVVTISVAGVAQQESIEELRARAEAGDAQAQFNLGLRYDNAQDYAEALRWYRLAAEQGNAPAQDWVGLAYAAGGIVPQDDAEAVRWFRLAADQGYVDALFNLGTTYSVGGGNVPQDYAEAVRWYRLGAEQGQFAAMRNLGLMYAEGRGVPQDDVQAHMWINLAGSRLSAAAARIGIRDEIVKLRDGVENRMTPDQRAEAQRLAREWDEAHPRD